MARCSGYSDGVAGIPHTRPAPARYGPPMAPGVSGSEGGQVPVTPEEAYTRLERHPAWIVERTRIYRDYRFPSFRDAVAFVVRVAAVAEEHGHHPNITLHEWCFVRLELYSQLRDCLTQADLDLAVALDALGVEPA
jgi:4a-hydroxytetrahydrobiopterin dehydratase